MPPRWKIRLLAALLACIALPAAATDTLLLPARVWTGDGNQAQVGDRGDEALCEVGGGEHAPEIFDLRRAIGVETGVLGGEVFDPMIHDTNYFLFGQYRLYDYGLIIRSPRKTRRRGRKTKNPAWHS